VLAIPMAIIALLVRWTSPGAVFYRQERMGLDGRAFTVFKIRSMVQHAEDNSGPVWARDDDPRTTPVGRWLRRFDLDELPQFWNVLKGDMSIVGPRPGAAVLRRAVQAPHPAVHAPPQGQGRHHRLGAGERLARQHVARKRIEYDLYYIENWSVTLDIKIMWLTLVRGLFQRSPPSTYRPWHASSSPAPPVHRLALCAKRCSIAATRWSAIDNLRTGAMANIAHSARPRLRVHPPRRHALHRRRRARGFHPALRQPGEPGGLPGAADPDAQGRVARHPQRAGLAKAKRREFLLASTSEVYGDPLVHPQTNRTGATSTRSGRAASTTRPSASPRRSRSPTTAITGSTRASSASSTPTGPAHAPARRPGRARVHVAGAARRGRDDLRRRLADAEFPRFISDLVAGILKLMEARLTTRSTSATRTRCRIREIAAIIVRLVNSKSKLVVRPLPVDDPKRGARHHRARTLHRLGAEGGLE
jgi:lipopolysaccharide/colanic/teichoic acid biosynthesis glycosyltransferase